MTKKAYLVIFIVLLVSPLILYYINTGYINSLLIIDKSDFLKSYIKFIGTIFIVSFGYVFAENLIDYRQKKDNSLIYDYYISLLYRMLDTLIVLRETNDGIKENAFKHYSLSVNLSKKIKSTISNSIYLQRKIGIDIELEWEKIILKIEQLPLEQGVTHFDINKLQGIIKQLNNLKERINY